MEGDFDVEDVLFCGAFNLVDVSGTANPASNETGKAVLGYRLFRCL